MIPTTTPTFTDLATQIRWNIDTDRLLVAITADPATSADDRTAARVALAFRARLGSPEHLEALAAARAA